MPSTAKPGKPKGTESQVVPAGKGGDSSRIILGDLLKKPIGEGPGGLKVSKASEILRQHPIVKPNPESALTRPADEAKRRDTDAKLASHAASLSAGVFSLAAGPIATYFTSPVGGFLAHRIAAGTSSYLKTGAELVFSTALEARRQYFGVLEAAADQVPGLSGQLAVLKGLSDKIDGLSVSALEAVDASAVMKYAAPAVSAIASGDSSDLTKMVMLEAGKALAGVAVAAATGKKEEKKAEAPPAAATPPEGVPASMSWDKVTANSPWLGGLVKLFPGEVSTVVKEMVPVAADIASLVGEAKKVNAQAPAPAPAPKAKTPPPPPAKPPRP